MLKNAPAKLSAALMMGLFAALCPARQVVAQQAPAPDTARSDSVEKKVQELRPVTVQSRRAGRYSPGHSRTATKTSALARDIPQSLVTITSHAARDQAMQGMADVLRYVSGATMGQGEGNRDQMTIRGNSSTADFFVDGVRDDVQYFRDLYNLHGFWW